MSEPETEGFLAARLLEPVEEVDAKICLGLYHCEDCGDIHFIEAPAELQ